MTRTDTLAARQLLLPAAAFLVVVAACFAGWRISQSRELRAVEMRTSLTSELVAAHLESDINTRVSIVDHLRAHWQAGDIESESDFRQRASELQEAFAGIVALNWVDDAGVIRWLVPAEENRAALGKDLTRHPIAAPILRRSLETGMLQATPPLELYQGGRGFAVYAPIWRGGRHVGYVSAAFRVEPLILRSIPSSVHDSYRIAVVDGALPVFDNGVAATEAEASYEATRSLLVAGRPWTLAVSPSRELVAAVRSPVDEVTFAAGVLLAMGIAFLSWRILVSRGRLAASETRFRRVVNDLPDLVCRFKPDTTLTFVNEAYARYFGRTPEQLVGTSFLDLVPEEKREGLRAHFTELDASQPVQEIEHEVVGPDGSVRWQRWRDRALLDDEGRVTEFQSVGVDVTEARRAEQALRWSERRFRAIFGAVSDGIAIYDARGAIVEANERVAELTGRTRDELLAQETDAIVLDEPSVQERGVGRWLADVEDGRLPRMLSWRTRDPRGRPWWAEVNVRRARIDDETRYVANVRDVSRRKRLEDQLRQSQKLQAVGTLAAGVAHDFNNIITAVLGFGETAYELAEDRPDARFAIDGIRQACEQAAGVTKSLLMFSRGASMERKPCELGELMRSTVRMLRHMVPAAVQLRADVTEDSSAWVVGDEAQIQQVLINLAINARDALPEGGTITMRLGGAPDEGERDAEGDAGSVVIVVEDDGVGMSEEVAARAIEPFFTTKPRERGTGLGLSVVHGIVAEHGGTMRIDSRPEQGTRVTIELPRCAAPTEGVARAVAESFAGGRGEAVLVVEDNDQVRDVIARTLARGGYEVVESADGVAGLEALARERDRIRLAIIDVDLPRRSGTSCLEEIRRADLRLPVILISGLPDQSPAAAGDAATAFLQKPFHVTALSAAVSQMLASPAARSG